MVACTIIAAAAATAVAKPDMLRSTQPTSPAISSGSLPLWPSVRRRKYCRR